MRALLIAAAGAASLFVFAVTVNAAPPVTTSIQIHPIPPFAPVETGTWTATGGINDSGYFARTDVHNTGSIPDCFCPPEHTGAFSETFLLTSLGSGATLTIRAEELLTPSDDPFGSVNGVWQIVSGTGAYDRASGHGTDYFGPPLTLYLTGEVSKVD